MVVNKTHIPITTDPENHQILMEFEWSRGCTFRSFDGHFSSDPESRSEDLLFLIPRRIVSRFVQTKT